LCTKNTDIKLVIKTGQNCFKSIIAYVFSVEQFVNSLNVPDFTLPVVHTLPATAHLASIGLGFCLSCLFFVDQNIAAALINAPQNK